MERKVSEELEKVLSPKKQNEEVDPHEKEQEELLKIISELIKKNKQLSHGVDAKRNSGWFTSDFGTRRY